MYLNVEAGADCHVAEYESELWQRRLGHASYGTINGMIKDRRIKGAEMETNVVCDVCGTSKQDCKSFNISEEDKGLRESALLTESYALTCLDQSRQLQNPSLSTL